MKVNSIQTKDILELEKDLGIELIVTERPINVPGARYFARFEECQVRDRGVIVGYYGEGPSVDDAIADYCIRISGTRLVRSDNGTEIELPRLTYTPPPPPDPIADEAKRVWDQICADRAAGGLTLKEVVDYPRPEEAPTPAPKTTFGEDEHLMLPSEAAKLIDKLREENRDLRNTLDYAQKVSIVYSKDCPGCRVNVSDINKATRKII